MKRSALRHDVVCAYAETGAEKDNEVPDAIHGDAIDDLACKDDRLWFDQNLSGDYRLRKALSCPASLKG